jgi:hypothetical protein
MGQRAVAVMGMVHRGANKAFMVRFWVKSMKRFAAADFFND